MADTKDILNVCDDGEVDPSLEGSTDELHKTLVEIVEKDKCGSVGENIISPLIDTTEEATTITKSKVTLDISEVTTAEFSQECQRLLKRVEEATRNIDGGEEIITILW